MGLSERGKDAMPILHKDQQVLTHCSQWEMFLESPTAAVLTRTLDISFAAHSGRRLGLAPFEKRTL